MHEGQITAWVDEVEVSLSQDGRIQRERGVLIGLQTMPTSLQLPDERVLFNNKEIEGIERL